VRRKDKLDEIIRLLEARHPQLAGTLCGNPGCEFYVAMLVAAEEANMKGTKVRGMIPPHSCIGFVGVTGVVGGKNGGAREFARKVRKARGMKADEISRDLDWGDVVSRSEVFEESKKEDRRCHSGSVSGRR
jgi:hypothetical protein